MSTQPKTPAPPSAQPGVVTDPYRAYNFKFEINSTVQGHFVSIEGLGVKVDRILFRAGGEHSLVRSIPGRVEYTPVTLRYGLTDSTEMIEWLLAAVEGRVQRQNVSIAMLDDSGSAEVRRWNLIAAWPCEWAGAPLDALGQELAIESLTLAYDRLELDNAPAPGS
jgi:phage tail-like protein